VSNLPPGYLDIFDRISMTLSRATGTTRVMANALLALADKGEKRVPWETYDLFQALQTVEGALVEIRSDMDKLHDTQHGAGKGGH
jgi:hypothetical protein